ncbi:hypothetical protein KP509_24G016700 [Ceratopteris richardii]|uniref:Uncharacterized protein n=1 Tax=Ceratopteris richardii TaxID=49495 RepID=A0A8T2RUW0_CERRI|nr:hypothetical protein KP509_24G016700 [Ceratopteris richardii]
MPYDSLALLPYPHLQFCLPSYMGWDTHPTDAPLNLFPSYRFPSPHPSFCNFSTLHVLISDTHTHTPTSLPTSNLPSHNTMLSTHNICGINQTQHDLKICFPFITPICTYSTPSYIQPHLCARFFQHGFLKLLLLSLPINHTQPLHA